MMTSRTGVAIAALLAVTCATASASAAVVYENRPTDGEIDCSYSTTCAATFNLGNVYAAQRFTLDQSVTMTRATVFNFDLVGDDTQPYLMNWIFLAVNGGGLPGQQLHRGTGAVVNSYGDSGYLESSFDLPDVTLAAGNYYLAVQAVSGIFETFLARGEATGGGAVTRDGGTTWSASRSGFPSIAVSLEGEAATTVPEPAAWAMMIVGFGAVGMSLRRRPKLSVGRA